MLTREFAPPASQSKSEPVTVAGSVVVADCTIGTLEPVFDLNDTVPLLMIAPAREGVPTIKVGARTLPDKYNVPPELIVVWFQTVTLSASIEMFELVLPTWLVRF